MGNSPSKTVTAINPNVPLKSALKKSTAFGPINEHKYSPTPYPPEQYFYPAYPTRNSVDANQNQFYAHSPMKNITPQQQSPRRHSNLDANSNHHQHQHHDHHRHHHHHHRHHHRPSQLSFEKENFNLSISDERPISPQPPSILAQKPVSSVVTHIVTPPVANKGLNTSLPVHHSSSLLVKKTSTPISIGNPLSPVAPKQHQTPPRIVSNTTHPSLLIKPNSFEKAPTIGTNYIAKSADDNALHSYTTGPLTVVQRSPLRHITPGNRWYDHDYDLRVRSFTTGDV